MSNERPMPQTDEEWKERLTPEQYRVLREKGTEAPFSGRLEQAEPGGAYSCAACGHPLFPAEAKFDSRSGWPSFDQALPDAVELAEDRSRGMVRTEVACAQCGSHLGHLFDDGPTPTGQRYCVNAICLGVSPNAAKEDANDR